MLPPPLVGVYQQYKQDTDSIAAWLASTAAAHGYSRDLLQTGSEKTQSTGRLKGKARKNAKKQAAGGTKSPPNAAPKYRIAIKDFTVLSEFISGKNIAVPRPFASTLDRLIKVRGGFGSQLVEHGKASNATSDRKHSFFVGVLQKVREILKPLTQTTVEREDARTPMEEAASRFAGLSVYEPSEEFLNAPDVERPQQTPGDDAVYEAEQSTSYADVMYAVGAMVNDLNKIRSRIDWIWSNYKIGVFDLAAAAIATNTAIDLARNLIDEVMPLAETHGGAWGILNEFYQLQARNKGFKTKDIFVQSNPADNFNYDLYDLGVDTFLLPYRIVEAFSRVLLPGQLPVYKEGLFGWYDASSDRGAKTGYQKFEEDRTLLTPFFTELMTVVRGIGEYPVQDEFLRGMEELNTTNKVPFYLVFAAQVFVDIHHMLRGQATEGFKELERHANFMIKDIKEHLEFHKNLRVDTWPKANDQFIMDRLKLVSDTLEDPVYKTKVKFWHKMRMSIPPTVEPNRILKMSPVLSGLLLYRFKSQHREIGLAIANAWGSVTYTAHLHNALQSEKLVAGKWQDMMLARTILGDSTFFVGDPPTNGEDYMRKFSLQAGVPFAAMTSTRRKNTALESKAGPRGKQLLFYSLPFNLAGLELHDNDHCSTGLCQFITLTSMRINEFVGIKSEHLPPVSSMFFDRYVNGSRRVDWTAEQVDQVIELSLYEEMGSEEEGTLMFGQIEEPEKIKGKQRASGNGGKKRKKASEGAVLSPEQLIHQLTFALNNEKLELSFPWLTMHRSCWRLLRAVKDGCDAHLRETVGPVYMEKESQLPFLMMWIFGFAGKGDMRLMHLAADAARGFYGRSGRDVLGVLHRLGMPIQFTTEDEFEAIAQESSQ
ncbi:uncharacterized protein JN550_011829 [Neoarthrinium moseri]|uniref:uncharacterized protein n=1 Tax=Neoarthrinium moseri TaxID=1658444 RepID=UPI001FDCD1F6|nr:uncharacterized protein JN550_011829 [Neoarthrinium moseri]KAI1859910.1 hypothetical protein JN550_011829 [Neoarthrinium moseri]